MLKLKEKELTDRIAVKLLKGTKTPAYQGPPDERHMQDAKRIFKVISRTTYATLLGKQNKKPVRKQVDEMIEANVAIVIKDVLR